MNTPFPLFRPIIESPHLLEIGPLVSIPRTWKERLFDWPWRPFQKTKQVRHWVPSTKIYDFSGALYAHPVTAARLRTVCYNQSTTAP